MNSRLGNILYGAGIIGALASLVYGVDALLVYDSGISLLGISGRFVSQSEMLIGLAFSVVIALLSWGAGWSARAYVNEVAQRQADEADFHTDNDSKAKNIDPDTRA